MAVYNQYSDSYSLPSNQLILSRIPMFGDYVAFQIGQYSYVLIDYNTNKVYTVSRSSGYNSEWVMSTSVDESPTVNITVPTAVYGSDYVLYGGTERVFSGFVGGCIVIFLIYSIVKGLIDKCLYRIRS